MTVGIRFLVVGDVVVGGTVFDEVGVLYLLEFLFWIERLYFKLSVLPPR